MMRVMLYEAAQTMLVRSTEMVLAQGLGDADRQAPRHEKGNRGAGASLGRHHAPHLALMAPSSAGRKDAVSSVRAVP